MEWSPQQAEALSLIRAWLDGPKQVFRLFGFAGTGKTTLARHAAELAGGAVLFCAPTGKAAHVLRRRGCHEASTVHRLIYLPQDKSRERLRLIRAELQATPPPTTARQAELRRQELEEIDLLRQPAFTRNPASPVADARLVVLDEASMVGDRMGEDLLSYRTKVLVLGDGAQLPPVASQGYFTREHPDFQLTEVHRQAAGSPVLRLATMVRQGQPLPLGDHGSSRVVLKGVLNVRDLLAHDQVLVGKNTTRRLINQRMRAELGRADAMPVPGDRVVCLRNDHQVGLLNGQQFEVIQAQVDGQDVWMQLLDPEDNRTVSVIAHREHFEGKEDELSPWDVRCKQCFEHALAMTTHKAQGSQWDSVCVLDQSRFFGPHAQQWLYTAITRASERVTVIRL